MVRHLSFRNPGEVVAEILRRAPSSVYCSNAVYAAPALPMEEKGWSGAELIFDIDATDVPTPCKKGHDIWYCENCHAQAKLPSAKLRKPLNCLQCGGNTAELHGTCKVCLDAAKDHTMRVLEFLAEDFGTSPSEVKIYFSGNRGYHVHVFDKKFDLLGQQARAEIADYLRGDSLPTPQSIASALRRRLGDSRIADAGWTRIIESFIKERRICDAGMRQKLVFDAISSRQALIDTSVTSDIHRVFRLAGSLHGNTGMCKKRVDSMDSFDPNVNPVVLSGEQVKVNVTFYPQFSIGGYSFGPFKSTTATIPTYAAVSILTRGFGEVA